MYILQFRVLFNLILILQLTFRPFSLNCEFVSYDSDLHVLFLLRIVNIYLAIVINMIVSTSLNLAILVVSLYLMQSSHLTIYIWGYTSSPSWERDTASPRGRYGERLQRDSCLKIHM